MFMEEPPAGTPVRSDGGHGVDPAAEMICARLAKDLDDGFAVLVRHEERVVYSVALRVTGTHQDAEDLAAETFLRAYRALRGFSSDRVRELRPRPWLLTITINTWRNTLRDRARRPATVLTADLPECGADGAGVEQLAERAEVQRELGALLARLPAPQRAAVVLRHVAGMSICEVAEALGCPEGTAKSHVSRGLAALRAHRGGSNLVAPVVPAGRRAGDEH
jgi:RNA polymerase sigma-70 factor (ECF subfamily)